jgi:hypothetical protein
MEWSICWYVGMWYVGMWNIECDMWYVGMWNVVCDVGMWNVGMWYVDMSVCDMWYVECGYVIYDMLTTTSWGWKFWLYPTSSPIRLKWKVPKFLKFPRNSIIDTFSLEYFAINFFSWNLNKGNNQGVLTWEMHGGPSTTSIVVLMWISKAHVAVTLYKL